MDKVHKLIISYQCESVDYRLIEQSFDRHIEIVEKFNKNGEADEEVIIILNE